MRYGHLSKEEQEERLEELMRGQERKALKNAIQSELTEKFNSLKEYAAEQYKLNDNEGEILKIKDKLQNEFSGQAKDALDERLGQHYQQIWDTNLHFSPMVSSLSANKGWFS